MFQYKPVSPEVFCDAPILGRASSNFNAGESCPAAKPSLATLEKSSLPATAGGLDDITAEFPNANHYNRSVSSDKVVRKVYAI